MRWFLPVCFSLFALSLTLGCEEESECPVMNGAYKPTYKKLFSTCDDFIKHRVCIESKQSGVYSCIESAFNNIVTTEIIFDGCRFDMDQDVQRNGVTVIFNEGYFEIISEHEATGKVNHFEYDDDGNLTCRGLYEVDLLSFEKAYETGTGGSEAGAGGEGTAGQGGVQP